jgi:membrane protein DedA with SNARE-associated domain
VPSVTAGVVRLRRLSFFEGVALSSLINDFIVIFLGFSARFILPRLDTQPKTYLGVSFCALIAFVWIILFLLYRHKSMKHEKQKEQAI